MLRGTHWLTRVVVWLYTLAAAGVLVFLTTWLLVAFLGWWALTVPLLWLAMTARYLLPRRQAVTLEHRLFAVGLARTNDV